MTGTFPKKTNHVLLGVFAATTVLTGHGNGADWPQWRGPNRDGVSDETGLRGAWPTNGPPLLWRVSGIGQGYGSVAVSGGTVYAAGSVDGEGLLTALTVDGRILWTRKYGAEHTGVYAGARSTPTVADGRVYVMSGTGTLVCFQAGAGEIAWRKDMVAEFGGWPSIKWGYGESVLIADNLAICTPGGSNVTCVALDRRTGATVWKSPGLGQRHAMCSPVLVRHGQKRLIMTQSVRHVAGICAETGALLWTYEMPQKGHHDDAVKLCTPICADGHVVVANSGTVQGGVKLRLADDGSSVSETWTQPRFQGDSGGAVLCRGRLYAAVGKGTWLCMDWATGDVVAELAPVAGRAGGTCIAADGHLLCRGLGGRLDLVRIAENAFEPVASFVLPDMPPGNEHRTPPALADGTLYVRYKDTLAAFALRR